MARNVDKRISLEKLYSAPIESEDGRVCLVSYEPTVRVSAETAAKVSCTLEFVQF
jgi:hypothetical protein